MYIDYKSSILFVKAILYIKYRNYIFINSHKSYRT